MCLSAASLYLTACYLSASLSVSYLVRICLLAYQPAGLLLSLPVSLFIYFTTNDVLQVETQLNQETVKATLHSLPADGTFLLVSGFSGTV